jgi:predicted amidophosphoribosyltransferase
VEVNLHELHGNWDKGFALHKHVLRSVPIGYNSFGHMQFDTTRSEPGEALYRLKYQNDFSQVAPLAQALFEHVVPAIGKFAMVIPMPATKHRLRQPVHEITKQLSELTGTLYADGLLLKNPPPPGAPEIKNLGTKAEKVAALAERFVLDETHITNDGKWGALLVDDKYDTGASVEAACAILGSYAKIRQIFVATCSW